VAKKILVTVCGDAYHKTSSGWSFKMLEGMVMTDQQPNAVQAQVRDQFDRQVAHYTKGSAMADQGLLELSVRMAGPAAGRRV
jgi:hypothetical protein